MPWRIATAPDGFPVPEECADGEFVSEVEAWKRIELDARTKFEAIQGERLRLVVCHDAAIDAWSRARQSLRRLRDEG